MDLQQSYHNDALKLNPDTANYKTRITLLNMLTDLAQINHLMSDDLCYYNVDEVCLFVDQRDVFSTGLFGAMHLLIQMYQDHQYLLLADDEPIVITQNASFWSQDVTLK